MNFSLPQMIATIQEDFNKQLDELELRLISLTDSTLPAPSEGVEGDAFKLVKVPVSMSCNSSTMAKFVEKNAPKSYEEIISYIRRKLARKASAKRLIEKANRAYVDLNFQKTSIQLTAQLYQKVQQEESAVEELIDELNDKVDEFHSKITQEFGELRSLIDEVKKTQSDNEVRRQSYTHVRGYRGQGKRNSIVPLLKRELRNNPNEEIKKPIEEIKKKETTFSYILSKHPIPPLYPSQNVVTQGKLNNAIHFDPVIY